MAHFRFKEGYHRPINREVPNTSAAKKAARMNRKCRIARGPSGLLYSFGATRAATAENAP